MEVPNKSEIRGVVIDNLAMMIKVNLQYEGKENGYMGFM